MNNTAVMLDTSTVRESMLNLKQNGIPKGISTGFFNLDPFYTIPPMGQLNVLTGAPGSGKSEIIDSIALHMSATQDWKIFYYSPENYPASFHLQKLCEKLANKPFFGAWHNRYTGTERPNVNEHDIDIFSKLIEKNFFFVDCHINTATVDSVLSAIFEELVLHQIDMAIIDPWNKLESQRPAGMSDHEFIGHTLLRLQMFAREKGIQFYVVAHPSKPSRTKDGSFAKISLYDISGSAHWYNMIDNGFIVHRSWSDKVGQDNLTSMKIAKIKDRRYGKCGEITLKFDAASGNFVPHDS